MKQIRFLLSVALLFAASLLMSGQPVDKKYKGSGFSKFSVSYGLTMFHYDQELKDYANYTGLRLSKPLNVVAIDYAVAWRLGYRSNWTLGFGFRAGMGFSTDKYSQKLSDSPYGQQLNGQLSELKALWHKYADAGYSGSTLSTVKSQIDYVDKLLNTKYNISTKSQLLTVTIPINIGYQFCLSDKVGLTPYAGINLKIIPFGRSKDEVTADYGTVPDELSNSDWVSIFDAGSPDIAWINCGWQVGLGLSIRKFYIGAESGTDFRPYQKVEFAQKTGKIHTQNLLISAGIYF